MAKDTDSTMTLPTSEDYPILLITGNALRHERFAMRIQEEFQHHIVGWLQLGRSNIAVRQSQDRRSLRESAWKAGAFVSKVLRRSSNGTAKFKQSGLTSTLREVEQKLFGKEVKTLRKTATLRPVTIDSLESEAALSRIERLKPFFVLAFCDPQYMPTLRAAFKGVILSQNDLSDSDCGTSPSVYWALYHRDLSRIVSAVHLWLPDGDTDIVVRTSTPCFAVDDIPEACFARETALGAELMGEVLANLITTRTLRFDACQKTCAGMNADPTNDILREVDSDLRRGLIKREVARKMKF